MRREQLESHLDAASRHHLDLACVKLIANQEEFKETTRKLESKIQAQKIFTWKLVREVQKAKEESPPYMWKINDFTKTQRDARRGKELFIESGHFFTGPDRYKLMLHMYPNGSRDGKNTHVSVYLYLLKGKYDAVLPWPFRKTVTFTLIDQQENTMHRKNHVTTLCCDGGSEPFARPVTDCNTGYGFHTFISHEKLQSRRFIVDDTLFLQVKTGPLS